MSEGVIGLPVALDAMGGDQGPAPLVGGAVRAVARGIPVLLVGDRAALEPLVPAGVDLPIRHAPTAVEMGEAPATAVRRKPTSSIVMAVGALRDGDACAAVSCGHTGATMAAALFGMGRLPRVSRPALATVVPRADGGKLVLLDLGANVDSRPEHLAQFAVMGACFARVAVGLDDPRVGLLSNGAEPGKGNELVREAAPLLAQLPLRFVGNIEPEAALRGGCEVLVCDGFVGNIMLKTVEATAAVVSRVLRDEVARRLSTRIGARLLGGILGRFRDRTDAQSVGVALLLGVPGVVVAGHGRSDERAVEHAIELAWRSAKNGLGPAVGAAITDALG
jgi:glycerol-3-phosphate acyltransferase PlsX